VATYESQPLPANATMIGGTVVTAKFTASGTDGLELNARLYDLFPDGTAVMVDRGPRRLSAGEAQHGEVQFQLHGNGWEFPAGHRVRIELMQDDEPYLKHSDVPSSLALGEVSLRIPIHQASFAGGRAFAPVAKLVAPRVSSSASTGPRFRIRWRGSSIGSPIAGFQVQTRTLAAASVRASVARWQTIRGLAATRRTSLRFGGREGRTYQFRVRVRTAAGRVSRWSSATTVVPLDERRHGFRYRGPWHRPRVRGAFRGRVATLRRVVPLPRVHFLPRRAHGAERRARSRHGRPGPPHRRLLQPPPRQPPDRPAARTPHREPPRPHHRAAPPPPRQSRLRRGDRRLRVGPPALSG
jgi:hypothetical protein